MHEHSHADHVIVPPMAPPASVLVDDLDEEHEVCAAALAALGERRDTAALRSVLEAYEAHFAHEEQLLDQHMYADVGDARGFSAAAGQRKSHFGDHQRQLAALQAEIARREKPGGDATPVPAAFVQQVMADFERHAADYDSTYAETLAAALAASA